MKYLTILMTLIAMGCEGAHEPANLPTDRLSPTVTNRNDGQPQPNPTGLHSQDEDRHAQQMVPNAEESPTTEQTPDTSNTVVPNESPTLDPRTILVRASIDLRGRRPSRQELATLNEQPESLDALIGEFVHGPKLGTILMDLAARWLRSRIEFYPFPNVGQELDDNFSYSVAEEPLRLFKYLVDTDRSYAEFVTADYTIINEILAPIWPARGYDSAQGGWQKVSYNDGRPAAGYLSSNAFHLRYLTAGINYNRGRANAASRILMCDNYLVRPIDFPRDIDLTDEQGIKTAIRTNDGCVACHATLDPLASYFGPFSDLEDTGRYDVDMLDAWTDTTLVEPAFNGRSGESIAELAAEIASDRRYARCLTQRLYEALLDRPLAAVDRDAVNRHTQAFIDSGLKIRDLIKSLVLDKAYRGANEGGRQGLARKAMSPELLDRVIQDLTGYRLTSDGIPLMLSDDVGYHILGGGLSAESGDYPPRTHNITRILVQNRLAEAAGWYVVRSDRQMRSRLLGDVDPTTDPMTRSDIAHILSLAWSRAVDTTSSDVDELLNLFNELTTHNLPTVDAWASVVSVVLRSPEFILY